MNSNKIILLLIGIVTCTLVVKKLTPIYTILLISLSIIGYSLSNDIISAISIASISVYIILYLNDSNYMETFKGWNFTLRLYQPTEAYFNGKWTKPELKIVK